MSYILKSYDNALENILSNGVKKVNRTGIETVAVFGLQSRYLIKDKFPLLTGRKVWPKSIFAELLWFLSGSTLNSDLQKLDSNIWTPWVDEDFERKNGYVEGAFGPVYGFQLRHFGGEYSNGDVGNPNYGKGGFDQLSWMVNRIKENPDCRRILFSLWNPSQMGGMRLPPCHYTFQIFIHENRMSGMLTQRSCDFPVGVPANIQFYSALIYMLAQQTGFEPYEFVHSTVDSHIYVDQIPAVEEYLSRTKPHSPRLMLNKAKDIFSYSLEDFSIVDYNPESKIPMPVAV